MTVALIASGRYVSDSMAAEFGSIPPAFLPLGNRRLYVRQVELLRRYTDRIYLSLPSDYDVPQADLDALGRLGVKIIRCSEELSIGAAISLCANIIGVYKGRLVILYGDTIIDGDALTPDSYSMHAAYDHQSWAPAPLGAAPQHAGDGRMVVSGMFSLSDIPLMLKSIALRRGDFLKALESYDQERPLDARTDGEWYDFGHVQTYFTSCGLITTQRSFNQISISANGVEKFSEDRGKLEAEARWLEQVPYDLRAYTAPFLGRIEDARGHGYRTANTYLSTLANLAVFGNLNVYVWSQIFDACGRFLANASNHKATPTDRLDFTDYYRPKTDRRLADFAPTSPWPIDQPMTFEGRPVPSMLEMSRIAGDVITQASVPDCVIIHGDFCFSNIFYDFRSRAIRLIDPRGIAPSGGEPTIYGDPRYDLAKLAHSIIGGYDMIIADRVWATCQEGALTMRADEMVEDRWHRIIRAFENSGLMDQYSRRVITAIMVHLFLSMLPLHSDNKKRQTCFLANAARLFLEMEA